MQFITAYDLSAERRAAKQHANDHRSREIAREESFIALTHSHAGEGTKRQRLATVCLEFGQSRISVARPPNCGHSTGLFLATIGFSKGPEMVLIRNER